MKMPCIKCIVLAACRSKKTIKCSLLNEYFVDLRNLWNTEEKIRVGSEFMDQTVRDEIWMKVWKTIQEQLPNCGGICYPVRSSKITTLWIERTPDKRAVAKGVTKDDESP